MQEGIEFKVFISGYHSSPEEWKRAFGAATTELPDLSEQEKQMASKFEVSEEDYKRSKLAGEYGRKRLERRGRALGEKAREILIHSGLEPNYKLNAVLWEGTKLRWLLRIQTPDKIVGVPVPIELADDLLDSEILYAFEKLKRLVLGGIGRDELLMDRTTR